MRTNIGQYRIESALGRGGMGVVYRGVHEQLGREVAIKALAPELTQQPEFKARFFSEAKTQAHLQHSNIVTVYDLLEDAGEYFIVMELVAGEGLDARLQAASGQAMDLGEALSIFSQVLAALDYAHSEGVIHRDIKPSNVLISASGRVKLMDFGIALLVGDKRLTASQATIGTPTYMSPEQILRPRSVDHRTDIYSAAVVLYEMLAGRPPFDDETEYAIKRLHVEAPPPDLSLLNPALPSGVVAAITAALSKNPDDRFPSAGAFLCALEEAAPLAVPAGATPRPQPIPSIPRPTVLESPVLRVPPAAPQPGRPEGRKLWVGAAAAGLALVVAFAVLLLVILPRGGGEPAGQVVVQAPPAARPLPRAEAPPPSPVSPEGTPAATVPAPEETSLAAAEPPPPLVQPPAPTRRAAAVLPEPEKTAAPTNLPEPQPEEEQPPAAVAEATHAPETASTAPAEPAPPPAADSAFAQLGAMEGVILTVEERSRQALEAYEEEDLDTPLGERLEEFADAAEGVRKAFRKTTGKGVGAMRDRLLKRASPEADQKSLEAQAKDLMRRGAQIDALLADNPMGPAAAVYWKEVQENLKRLGGFFAAS